MEKEFISYEEALALKELGFNEPCLFAYNQDDENKLMTAPQLSSYQINTGKNSDIGKINKVTAPLYQQAFRWFREKYDLNANVYKWQPDFSKSMGHLEWEGSVTHFTEKKVGGSEYFNTYEEAEIFCLKNLIEIVKNK